MKNIVNVLIFSILSTFAMAQASVYDFTAKKADGKTISLSEYKGKVLLVVNSATHCGFTPQYMELEAIYEKFHDKGFEILDFPCNQFGEQAPGSIAEIQQFCTKFNITFQQFDKIDVNGENEHPLFAYLKSQKTFEGFGDDNKAMCDLMNNMLKKQHPDYMETSDIKWNFTKFLIDKDGNVIQRFEPTADMSKVEKAIEKLCK
ncbi:MAG: glutathione peroxidase [Bacteroidales bacterium]|jgi:glutathione peroxidase|nr:glutathione peroxidase [Bacteroidales bacterium]